MIVCHNDPAVWNLVVSNDRMAFIDWDVIGWRPPIWDVAYCAISVVPLNANPPPVAPRLRALADGYGLGDDDRARLPDVIVARITSSYEHLKRRALARIAPWDQLWRKGHGDAWLAMRNYAQANAPTWSLL